MRILQQMKLLGILNITPDSFSDGGAFASPQQAADYAAEMVAQGAAAVDIGAESTRPNATPIGWQEEWERLEPVLQLTKNIPLSLDSYHPETVERALAFPQIQYLNDVSGFASIEMGKLAAKSGKKLIMMHSLTVPADPKVTIEGSATETIENWIKNSVARLKNFQIAPENVIFDVGIGFGKTAEQSIELIKNISVLTQLAQSFGAKMLVGHSRKSFLAKFTDKIHENRDFETAILTSFLATQNVDYVRVHNVPLNQQAILIGGLSFS